MFRCVVLWLLFLAAVIDVGTTYELRKRQRVRKLGNMRIVGGIEVAINKRPFQLSLQVDGMHDCGASIIGHWWAITAAHCVRRQKFHVPYRAITLRAGSDNLRHSEGEIYRITKIVVHQNFTRIPFRNDIALLKVRRAFVFGDNVNAIHLPEPDEEFEAGSNVTTSGWGFTIAQNWSSLPDVLNMAYLLLVGQKECEQTHGNLGKIDYTNLCAGFPSGGVDACRGDSGGPLEMDGVLIGIVSWGKGCGKINMPGVYTNVAAYRNWIKTHSGL